MSGMFILYLFGNKKESVASSEGALFHSYQYYIMAPPYNSGINRHKKEALAVGTFGAVRVLRYFHYIKRERKCQQFDLAL